MNWNSNKKHTTYHACGNGKVCCYSDGPNIVQIFGPCYSSPNFLTMEMQDEGMEVKDRIDRRRCGGIYHHLLSWETGEGEITEFVHSTLPVYIQSREMPEQIEFKIRACAGGFTEAGGLLKEAQEAYIAYLPAGTIFYGIGYEGGVRHGYTIPHDQVLVIAVTGTLKLLRGGRDGELVLKGGTGNLFFSFEWDEPKALSNLAEVLKAGVDSAMEDAVSANESFHRRRTANAALPDEVTGRLDEAMFSVAELIRAQQGEQGGVLAGHNYHLAYVRDQFGVQRGLLTLGCYDEVKRILLYYNDVFTKHGRIHNAQGIGVDAFHVHENDEAEITGYLVIGVIEYITCTGDYETFKKLVPMVMWAMDAQADQLCHGMLSFNGDETYVAGGILPRSALSHGSAEATMLYHTAGIRLLPLLSRYRLAESGWIARQEAAIAEIERYFGSNFIRDGQLYCNQPALADYRSLPKARHGVRECGHGFFGWCYPNREGRYVCPECVNVNIGSGDKHQYLLNSVALMPYFISSDLVPEEILRKMVFSMLEGSRRHNRVSSLPGKDFALGYDYGMLLSAASRIAPKDAVELFSRTLAVRDEAGAWAEYYRNDCPEGTYLRPWESGINIWALITAAKRLYQ